MNEQNKKPIYICLEGVDGTGKTTQCQRLVDVLRLKGYKVLDTKEPGTHRLPITMVFRDYMLNAQYRDVFSPLARECLSQIIRSIHMNQLIFPVLDQNIEDYDFIVQDRGIMSGIAYGIGCKNDPTMVQTMANINTQVEARQLKTPYHVYDTIFYFQGNVKESLDRAIQCKQEFKQGDVMEQKGGSFMLSVEEEFKKIIMIPEMNSIIQVIDTVDKTREQITDEMILILEKKYNFILH